MKKQKKYKVYPGKFNKKQETLFYNKLKENQMSALRRILESKKVGKIQ